VLGLFYVRLGLYGLTEQKIKGDGNCQVSSLQYLRIVGFDLELLRLVTFRVGLSLQSYKGKKVHCKFGNVPSWLWGLITNIS
jgi:hypothetical protein